MIYSISFLYTPNRKHRAQKLEHGVFFKEHKKVFRLIGEEFRSPQKHGKPYGKQVFYVRRHKERRRWYMRFHRRESKAFPER